MNTNEEILYSYSDEAEHDASCWSEDTIYKAMDKRAKQEAIEFAKFCMDNTAQDMNTENKWTYSNYTEYTDDELYSLFKEHQLKK